jgi:histone H3/H4
MAAPEREKEPQQQDQKEEQQQQEQQQEKEEQQEEEDQDEEQRKRLLSSSSGSQKNAKRARLLERGERENLPSSEDGDEEEEESSSGDDRFSVLPTDAIKLFAVEVIRDLRSSGETDRLPQLVDSEEGLSSADEKTPEAIREGWQENDAIEKAWAEALGRRCRRFRFTAMWGAPAADQGRERADYQFEASPEWLAEAETLSRWARLPRDIPTSPTHRDRAISRFGRAVAPLLERYFSPSASLADAEFLPSQGEESYLDESDEQVDTDGTAETMWSTMWATPIWESDEEGTTLDLDDHVELQEAEEAGLLHPPGAPESILGRLPRTDRKDSPLFGPQGGREEGLLRWSRQQGNAPSASGSSHDGESDSDSPDSDNVDDQDAPEVITDLAVRCLRSAAEEFIETIFAKAAELAPSAPVDATEFSLAHVLRTSVPSSDPRVHPDGLPCGGVGMEEDAHMRDSMVRPGKGESNSIAEVEWPPCVGSEGSDEEPMPILPLGDPAVYRAFCYPSESESESSASDDGGFINLEYLGPVSALGRRHSPPDRDISSACCLVFAWEQAQNASVDGVSLADLPIEIVRLISSIDRTWAPSSEFCVDEGLFRRLIREMQFDYNDNTPMWTRMGVSALLGAAEDYASNAFQAANAIAAANHRDHVTVTDLRAAVDERPLLKR